MRRWIRGAVLACLLLVICISPALAQQGTPAGQRDMEFEQQVYDRLAKINPDAVPVFKEATSQLDQGNLDAAREGYENVLALAPDFPDALRRLSYIYSQMEDYATAEILARRAMEVADTPENQTALAAVLLSMNTPADNQEAYSLAKKAAEAQPEDAYNNYILMFAAVAIEDTETVRKASAAVIEAQPTDPIGHYYAGIAAAVDERWELAEKELLYAQDLGMPAEDVQMVLSQGISAQARQQRLIRWGLYFLGFWAATLGLLFLVGFILSRVTLASLKNLKRVMNAEISAGERLLRRIYRSVIAITSVYFYISIPVLLLSVIVPVALIFYGFLKSGHVPVKFAFFLLIAAVYTLYAVVRSLFIRRKEVDPGRELTRAEGYYLWQEMTEIARRLGTRPVDKIFVTPGTGIAVFERGSWLKRVGGKGEWCLLLGLGALPGINLGQFRSIIAHEYGHFIHADTAGGDLAWRTQFTIQNMGNGLVQVGTATWYNPAWLFINGFYRVFLRITSGATRLQEVLADRFAVVNYGVDNFRTGLENLIRQDLVFDFQLKNEVNQARKEKRGLNNLYQLATAEGMENLETEFAKAREKPTSPYDTHPSFKERVTFVEQVMVPPVEPSDTRPALELIPSAEFLQKEMTQVVEKNLRERQILAPV